MLGIAGPRDSRSQRPELNAAAEIVEPVCESLDSFGEIATGEVIGTEIAVFNTVLEHVVGGSKHGELPHYWSKWRSSAAAKSISGVLWLLERPPTSGARDINAKRARSIPDRAYDPIVSACHVPAFLGPCPDLVVLAPELSQHVAKFDGRCKAVAVLVRRNGVTAICIALR
jgi:hypothetical protein